MFERIIPVGKAMAEALLESDESTASLSDASTEIDCFEEPQFIPLVRYPNSHATTCIPRDQGRPTRDGRSISPTEMQCPHGTYLSPSVLYTRQTSFAASRYVALDCEMVGVGPGGKRSVLARVSIVDYFGQCLLDRYVKVEERVTDYRHHVTGICAKDLSSASAVSFGKCRQQVISLMRGKVLVGHALENDLSVLGIHHPWHDIRDTSIYYPYQKKDRYGRIGPSRLCHLAKIHLGIDIQKKGQPHCPVEDACAAMALYRKNQPFWDSLVDSQRCNMLNV